MVPEPVRPEDEDRIDDVEKAKAMAEAEDNLRTDAAELKRKAEDPRYREVDSKEQYLAKAESRLKRAEQFGEIAGEEFDAERQAKIDEVKKNLGMQ